MNTKSKKIVILLVIVFAFTLIISKNVFATENKTINNLSVTMIKPIVGESLANKHTTWVYVDGEELEVMSVEWYTYEDVNGTKTPITDSNVAFEKNVKYAVEITFKRPNTYEYSSTASGNINGKSINMNNIEEFNYGSSGDANYDYDCVIYNLGNATPKTPIENLEIEVPEPIIGEKISNKVSVKLDGNECEITSVKWWTYENINETWTEITDLNETFKENKKYIFSIDYTRSNIYEYVSTSNFIINGNKFDINNAVWFSIGNYGNIDIDEHHDILEYDFGEAKEVKVVEKNDKDTNIKLEAEKGVVSPYTKLEVSKIENGNTYVVVEELLKDETSKITVFEIDLKENGVKIQPNGKVKISIPIPEDYDSSNLIVYRIEEGKKIKYDVKVETIEGKKYATFETDHFSTYVLAEKIDNKAENKLDETPKTGSDIYTTFYTIVGIASIIVLAVTIINKKNK